jgi:uncharacterized protein with HEPN domain
MPHDDRVYLQHIRDASERIGEYVKGMDEAAFKKNLLVQDAVIRQIEIMGEATKRLSSRTKELQPDIPWRDIAGMRDKLIHDYFGVDIERVWLTVTDDLPEFASQISALLSRL